jgi:3-deoxy-7-phosphoheptulonate synthase
MPVGFKNRTDGNVQVAIDAVLAARERHLFPSLTKEGAPAIFETSGNRYGHLVLRGGSATGPNFGSRAVAAAVSQLRAAKLPEVVMIDCSHGNSEKQPERQVAVIEDVLAQRKGGQAALKALMIESHLVGGRQQPGTALTYGQSITDACLGFAETERAILALADGLR